MSSMPAVVQFKNIKIAPFTELLRVREGLSFHKGGPIWPDWDKRSIVRHCRDQGPVDTRPDEFSDEAVAEIITEPAAWCGPISLHFGHCIADFSTRIPVYASMQPLPLLLFCCPPAAKFNTLEQAPAYFQQILRWYGVPSAKVKLISHATLARSLICVGQQERLRQRGPNEHYLNLLLKNAQRNHLSSVERKGVVFVSRAGIQHKLAGESYLETYLCQIGVTVLRPESLPLPEQLFIYAHAHTLIFSEGSALHALQLLGKQLGHVHVLCRRPGSKIAAASLGPRTESLQYHQVGELLCGIYQNHTPATAHGITWTNPEMLFQALAQAGLPRGEWSQTAFEAAAGADLKNWHALEQKAGRHRAANSLAHIAAQLARLGFE